MSSSPPGPRRRHLAPRAWLTESLPILEIGTFFLIIGSCTRSKGNKKKKGGGNDLIRMLLKRWYVNR
ncbi:hypothetical protein BDV39DRAFT_168620 [Aspergillus sergii]|uniref:Uncharacterized protein n=1 Tax=Aspergillus sergii TaxID=1034303 RepID=A0A5N6XEY7_9EURO|nr:hypothetical protein BDV39DRAFT_168620 [Aspergillus sergii]